jgi:hypothetical protein
MLSRMHSSPEIYYDPSDFRQAGDPPSALGGSRAGGRARGEGGRGAGDTCKVTLRVKNPNTNPGDKIMIVGSHPALGRWMVQQGVVMETSKDDFPIWRTQV